MKKLLALFGIVSIASAAFSAPTANEDFVVAEDARTYTNAVAAAKEYTDAAIAALPPSDPPGNYAVVSNKAMTALQEHQPLTNYYTKSQVETSLATKAKDNAVVKLTGDQMIGGQKTFTNEVYVRSGIAVENNYTDRDFTIGDVDEYPYGMFGITGIMDTGRWGFRLDKSEDMTLISLPSASGTLALESTVAAAATDATNHTDAVADQVRAALTDATNDLWQAIESIEPSPGPSTPCPVASRSWNRPGEWTIDYAPIMAPQSSEFIDLFTDAVGIVFSNVTRTASRGLTAQIYSESLDLLGEDVPPALASIIVSDGGSAAGDIVTVPTSGLYRVRGIAVTGAAREIAVSFAADAAKKTFESYYLSDTNANRAAVNDYAAAALAGMGAVRTGTDSAGNAYTIYSTCLPGFGAKNGTGQFAPYAIAPKFAASAAHYPWVDCQNQTYTVNGDTFTVTRGGPVFNLGTWAATNGFTEAELRAGGAYDVAIIPLAEGREFPAAACPYFATPEWIARNYISLCQLTVWTVAQTSEYGIPTVLTGDGADGKLYYWLSAGGLQPGNPRPRFDLAALIGEYNERAWWRIQVGDSGKPVWFVDQSSGSPRPILISHFEYVTGGPNYTALARVVAALCAAFDTTIKLLQ